MIEQWPAEEAQSLRRIAMQVVGHHDCQGSRRVDMRENCGACVCGGYYSSADRRARGFVGIPNYAGWLRVYIQLGRSTRREYAALELASAKTGTYPDGTQGEPNPHYYNAILRDVLTFGCPLRHRSSVPCPLCEAIKVGAMPIPDKAN